MNKQHGFSLIELIIVVVILSLLAVTALPRFLNVAEQAEDASVEGVAGGFASAVGLARAEWEIEGRPAGENAFITMDLTQIRINEFGFPTAGTGGRNTGTNLSPSQMTASACKSLFDGVMQSSVRSVIAGNDASNVRYYISVQSDAGQTDGNIAFDLCLYHLIATLQLNETTGVPEGAVDFTTGNSFTYNPATGQVQVFSNNT